MSGFPKMLAIFLLIFQLGFVAGICMQGTPDSEPAAQAHRDKFGRVIVSEKDRIYELTSRIEQLEIELEGTRNYLDETKPWFDEATLSIAKIHDRLNKLEAPETFPEPATPEVCK